MEAKISVVLPSYNQFNYLKGCLDSIISQNYPNLEIIVFDGGSKDGSIDLLESYRSHISYLKIGEDKGQSDALYQGFSIASGEILCWLNSDDMFNINTLFKVNQIYKNSNKICAIYGNLDIIDDNSDYVLTKYLTPLAPILGRKSVEKGIFGFYQPSFFFSKSAYSLTSGINPDLFHCMDNDLFKKLSQQNVEFIYSNNTFSSFRIHSMSKTSNYSSIARKEQNQLFGDRKNIIWIIIRLYVLSYRFFYYLFNGRLVNTIKTKQAYLWLP